MFSGSLLSFNSVSVSYFVKFLLRVRRLSLISHKRNWSSLLSHLQARKQQQQNTVFLSLSHWFTSFSDLQYLG